MQFDEAFFNGEEREGFFVEEMMKRAWAAQLEILEEIDAVCSRYNIEYFADWGTMLGAVRHGGFIPWDDDIDIGMKRMDYERFIKVAQRELPQEYKYLTARNYDEWDKPFFRITNGQKVPFLGKELKKFHGCPYVVGIDIFPIDYLPNNRDEQELMINLFRSTYCLSHDWRKEETNIEEKMSNLREIEALCNVKFTDDKPYQQQLLKLSDQVAAMYWDMEAEAKECTLMYMLEEKENFRLPVSAFESMIRVPFENTTVPIPIGYEQILSIYYGEDYMVPKQYVADHEYPFYKKQQKILLDFFKTNGLEIPEYLREYQLKELENGGKSECNNSHI